MPLLYVASFEKFEPKQHDEYASPGSSRWQRFGPKKLLEDGAEIHSVGETGSAILRRAAMMGEAEELKALAKRGLLLILTCWARLLYTTLEVVDM